MQVDTRCRVFGARGLEALTTFFHTGQDQSTICLDDQSSVKDLISMELLPCTNKIVGSMD
jgi:hypothetical protein